MQRHIAEYLDICSFIICTALCKYVLGCCCTGLWIYRHLYLYTMLFIFVQSKIYICIQHSSYLYKTEFIFAYSRGSLDLSISTFQQIVNTCKLCPPKWDLAVFLFSYLRFSLWVCVERGSGWVEKKLKGQVKANMHNLGPLSSSAGD